MHTLFNTRSGKRNVFCDRITFLQVMLMALLFANIFVINKNFFNTLITSKGWGLELTLLPIIFYLVISFPFKYKIQFSNIDLLVVSFCGWFIFQEVLLQSPYSSIIDVIFNVTKWITIYLFLRTAAHKQNFLWGIAIVWMLATLLQSGLGLMQLYGLERSYHELFRITGTFHNPGPFSGFVVSALPLSLGIICYLRVPQVGTDGHKGICLPLLNVRIPDIFIFSYSMLTLAWLTLIAILLVLPPANSRAAWIAGLAGVLFVLAGHPALLSLMGNIKKKVIPLRKTLHVLLLIVIFSFIAIAGISLYAMRKDSADGRLLIWQVTTQIIKQKPITGHGTNGFHALYMNEQANWFATGKGTETHTMLAGSPEAPFNELLKLWLEKGLIGILLAGGILYFIFFPKRKFQPGNTSHPQTLNPQLKTKNPLTTTVSKGVLISLLMFSMFSYPFDISPFILQLIILTAILAGTSKTVHNITGRKTLYMTIPAIILFISATIYFIPQRQAHYQAMETWQQADQFYTIRSYPIAVKAYEEAFPVLRTNGLFLQMYGKALSLDGQYEKSNEILTLAQQRFSSQIIQNTLGNIHKASGNYTEAEAAYIKSAQMIPSLLFPKYLLAKLYIESGQQHKAKQTAEEILSHPVRVESSATREIINEMKSIISEQ